MVQEIYLDDYVAAVPGKHYLMLGTKDSYGLESLQIIPGPMWAGLIIIATFVTPEKSIQVLVPEDGRIDVPQEATAQALSLDNPGTLVFTGTSSGVQRITCDLTYFVEDHAPTEGSDPEPTPSIWEQFVTQVQQYARQATQSATEAATSETNAAASAIAAAGSAADAAAELEKVQDAGTAALQGISDAQTAAVGAVNEAGQQQQTDIQQAGQTAVQQVQQAGTAQTGAVNTAGQAQQTAIQQAGTAQVNAVNTAGDAKLSEIEKINALLPTPTEADAGKAPIAQPDGTYALDRVTVDAYTKAQSDARYAPIESAIKVKGVGTGIVSLASTVALGMQGMKLCGRSWQAGTPSVENPVPIQSAGQGGQVDVTVCGENLANIPDYESQKMSVSNGVVTLSGEFETSTGGRLNFVKLKNPLFLPKGQYFFKLYTTKSASDCQMQAQFLETQDIYSNSIATGWYGGGSVSVGGGSVINVLEDSVFNYFNIDIISGAFDNDTIKLMLNAGDTAQPYQPYTSQHLPIPTPDGLPGIPVDSGGNWTDEAGQQWISDTLDLAKGVYTKRCLEAKITQDTSILESFAGDAFRFQVSKDIYPAAKENGIGICNSLPVNSVPLGTVNDLGISGYTGGGIYFRNPAWKSLDDVKEYLSNTDIVFMYPLASPIEKPLDSATIAAYRALTTYPGTTNVLAPDAGIEASALADPNQWVQEQIQAAVTQAVKQAMTLTGGTA